MFTAIAPRYDLLNGLLSLTVDKRWRRLAIDRPGWEETRRVATSTCARVPATWVGNVQGVAASRGTVLPPMQKYPAIRPVAADALQAPFPSAHFDGCVVGFGVRNLADFDAAWLRSLGCSNPQARGRARIVDTRGLGAKATICVLSSTRTPLGR